MRESPRMRIPGWLRRVSALPLYPGLKSPFEVQQFLDNLGYRFIHPTRWRADSRYFSAVGSSCRAAELMQ